MLLDAIENFIIRSSEEVCVRGGGGGGLVSRCFHIDGFILFGIVRI